MTRSALAAVLALMLLGGGCSDGGEGPAPGGNTGRQAVGGEPRIEMILAEPPPAVVELATRTPELVEAMERATERTYAGLDRRVETADPASGGDPAGRARPAAFVPVAAAVPRIPGVHLPVREHQTRTTTDSGATTTVETSAQIADQAVTMTISATTTTGDPATTGARAENEVRTEVALCQPPEETAVSVTVRQVTAGKGAGLTFEATGTFVQGSDGLVRVEGLDVTTRGVERGRDPRVDHLRVSSDGWDPAGRELLSEAATYEVAQSGDWSTDEGFANQIALAGLLAGKALDAALKDARHRTESGGLCVLLLASSDKNTLAPGESADIGFEVVDARTGEPVEGATVTASGLGGDVTPASAPAPGTMTFHARGTPDYWAFLEVRTPRGGDDANIPFNGSGWRFEGTSYTATAPGHPGPIEVTTTWSGQVCGDPFTDSWQVEVTISSPVASHTVALEGTAKPVERAPTGVGARLLIGENPSPGPGEPSFRLWVDEENPETRPAHHRVEVTELVPIDGACVQ